MGHRHASDFVIASDWVRCVARSVPTSACDGRVDAARVDRPRRRVRDYSRVSSDARTHVTSRHHDEPVVRETESDYEDVVVRPYENQRMGADPAWDERAAVRVTSG